MTIRKIILTAIAVISFVAVNAQITVKGKVQNGTNSSPLQGASIVVKDTTGKFITGMNTSADGSFILKSVNANQVRVNISFIGYKPFEKRYNAVGNQVNIGTVILYEESTDLNSVEIQDKAPASVQKGDTTEMNASSYKVNQDATTQDLVQKMPGVTVQDGKLQAQGEGVKKVLVDGKEYFGDDATSALQNIPAEVVEKIQIFDQWSEQSQFTGFNDGNTSKTINVVTKNAKRKIVFGKVYAGYGTDNRYQAALLGNYFAGERRITIAAQSNNVNIQNFEVADLLGATGMTRPGGSGMPRGGPGGRGFSGGNDLSNFMVNSLNGITQTHAGGINYTDKFGDKVKLSTSYFINYGDNTNDQKLIRNYLMAADSGQKYQENSLLGSININHRFSMKLEYQIDSFNSIVFRPRVTAQVNNGTSAIDGTSSINDIELSKTLTSNSNGLEGLNASGEFLYRHAFRKKRRTFSIGITPNYSISDGKSDLLSRNDYYSQIFYSDTLNQQATLSKNGWSASSNLTYTEPIGKNSIMSFDYTFGYKQNSSDKETYDLDFLTNQYTIFDTALTNVFNTDYYTHNGGVGYMYRVEKMNFTVKAAYQYSELYNNQSFPYSDNLAHYYNSVLPSAMFRYNFSKQKNISINYSTSASSPSVDQLQNVVNNSNPLLLTAGNPGLNQDYQHRVFVRYSSSLPAKSRTFFVMLSGTISGNYIGNNIYLARKDTMLENGLIMARGSQLTKPENMSGYYNLRSFLVYGFPLNFMKSNLNINFGLNYSRVPSITNGVKSFTNTPSSSFGLVISSNISEKLDFTISSNTSYNLVQSTKSPEENTQYLNQNSMLKFSWNFYKGFVYRTDINHRYYSGLTTGYNKDYLLWNMELGYKFFKQLFEVKVSCYDILNQNNFIQRTNTDYYTEDLQSVVLNRYFMLTASFKLGYSRKGNNNNAPSDNKPKRDGIPPQHMD